MWPFSYFKKKREEREMNEWLEEQMYQELFGQEDTNQSIKQTSHLLLVKELVMDDLIFAFKDSSNKSGRPTFIWNKGELFLGEDEKSIVYSIPFLWLKSMAKRNIDKFDKALDAILMHFYSSESHLLFTRPSVYEDSIKKQGFVNYTLDVDANRDRELIWNFITDIRRLNIFYDFFGKNVKMNKLLRNKYSVSLPSEYIGIEELVNEIIKDYRTGNI